MIYKQDSECYRWEQNESTVFSGILVNMILKIIMPCEGRGKSIECIVTPVWLPRPNKTKSVVIDIQSIIQTINFQLGQPAQNIYNSGLEGVT